MDRIPEELINQIRNKADIVEVIGSYIPLTKKGKNYMAVCPFHDDHNPSMSISEDKQIYHCFVCGAGGNVFKFVSDYEHISFIEAVKKVADMVHIEIDDKYLSYSEHKVDPKIDKLYKVYLDAINYTNYELGSVIAKPYKEYLLNRGINEELIKKFELGYNPQGDNLYKFLLSRKHEQSDIVECGLANITSYGLKDVFTNRITIPIHDAYGNPIAFSARRVNEDDSAKYINTSETSIYHKGNTLFNYHRIKNAVKKSGKVIVVEGAMDVIAYEKVGIDYALATLGTAVTDKQIKLLKRLNTKVVVSYDGDKAGQLATYKLVKLANNENLEIEIVNNLYGLDPDEIIEKHGKEALIELSNKTISFVDFCFRFLQTRLNLENYSEKKKFAELINEEIIRLKNDFEKKSYYKKLYDLTGFDMENTVKVNPVKINEIKKDYHLISGIEKAQYQIIALMLLSSRGSELFRDELGFLPDETYNKLAIAIIDNYRLHSKVDTATLLDEIKDDEVKNILLEISMWDLAPKNYDDIIMKEAISKIKICLISKKIERLQKSILETSDQEKKFKIFDEVAEEKRKIEVLLNGKKN